MDRAKLRACARIIAEAGCPSTTSGSFIVTYDVLSTLITEEEFITEMDSIANEVFNLEEVNDVFLIEGDDQFVVYFYLAYCSKCV